MRKYQELLENSTDLATGGYGLTHEQVQAMSFEDKKSLYADVVGYADDYDEDEDCDYSYRIFYMFDGNKVAFGSPATNDCAECFVRYIERIFVEQIFVESAKSQGVGKTRKET